MKIREKRCHNDSSVIYIASSKSCQPKRFVRRWNRVGKRYIQEQQQNHGFCQWNGQECGQVLVSEWKNGGGSCLFEW